MNTTSGSGVTVSLIDIEELAWNGSTNAVVEGSVTGSGAVNLSLMTGMYSGAVEFAFTARALGGVRDVVGPYIGGEAPAGR